MPRVIYEGEDCSVVLASSGKDFIFRIEQETDSFDFNWLLAEVTAARNAVEKYRRENP